MKPPTLQIKNILEFYDSSEKNIMIVADQAVFTNTRKLANEFGVDFDPQGSIVTDGVDNNTVATEVLDESELIISKTKGIVYSGVGLRLDPKNYFAFPLLKASENAFSVDEKGKVISEGASITLVAGYQVLLYM